MRVPLVLLLLAACLLLAGCTTLRGARLPGPVDGTEEAVVVHQGMKVRITLVSGAILTGEVAAASAESITLGKPSNYGYEKTEIARVDIARLEAERDTKATSLFMGGLGTVFVLGLGLMILLVTSLDGRGLS
jgi:hypothetical protein